MLRVFFVVSLTALLVGCASAPKPEAPAPVHREQKAKAPAKTAVPAKAESAAPSPEQTFKERWLGRFFRNRAQ